MVDIFKNNDLESLHHGEKSQINFSVLISGDRIQLYFPGEINYKKIPMGKVHTTFGILPVDIMVKSRLGKNYRKTAEPQETRDYVYNIY